MSVIVKSIVSGGAKLAATYNEDGTQNLIIADNGTVLDLVSLTADADATAEDVAEGKIFYAQGYRRIGTGTIKGSVSEVFGDGSDGVGLFSANTTWEAETEDTGMIVKNFESLTISEGVTVSAGNRNCGMIIRVKGDCTIAGGLVNKLSCKTLLDSDGVDFSVYPASMLNGKAGDGGNGGDGAAHSGGSKTARGGAGGTGMVGRFYGGGWSAGGGGAGYLFNGNYLNHGGAGGDATNINTTVADADLFVAGAGKNPGSTEATGNAGKNGGAGAAFLNYGSLAVGPGGSPSDVSNYSGPTHGGNGNYGGGVIILLVGGNLTITGTIDCSGGDGGHGGNKTGTNASTINNFPSGGGAGGGGGGRIFICHKGDISNSGTLNVNGGAGGEAGTAGYRGSPGNAGTIGTTAVKTYEQYLEEDVE